VIATVRKARSLEGDVTVPGDKSISHRALILGSIADGESRFRGLSSGADVMSTASCMRALGVHITDTSVRGVGMKGLRHPAGALDCGNSGTTMRLLAGLLSAQPFSTELRGDDSLTRRPMDRVVTPLREMGADSRWPPLVVGGQTPLHGIEYRMPVASAQVKSGILLAGLYAEGPTAVIEPVATRNHTELMLSAMGAEVAVDGRRVEVRPADRLAPLDIEIPGDVSAASFWLVASGLLAGSGLRIRNVGTNPTRTAFVDLLRACGIAIALAGMRTAGGEQVGDLEVAPGAELRPVSVDGSQAAEMIDELAVLAVAASQLPGTSRITGAAELRVKESDRIAAMAEGLAAMGADIKALDDGWVINGPRHLEGARVDSHRDHRVAMALAVAGLLADGATEIEDAECVEISYPGFFDQLESLWR
jgi:3-phosphoshikimate 1-carboxyvinyltransferase